VEGEAHNQTFHVSCALPSLDRKTTGTGSSRRVAEQQAALNALKELGVENQ
jgi:ribonuclease-3